MNMRGSLVTPPDRAFCRVLHTKHREWLNRPDEMS
jgi:hypothetical protein